MVDAFPGGELAFDTQSKFSAVMGNIALKKSGMDTARLRWGVRTARPILRLNRNLEMIDQFVTFSKFAADYFTDPRMRESAKVMDLMRTMTIVHVRLGDRTADQGSLMKVDFAMRAFLTCVVSMTVLAAGAMQNLGGLRKPEGVNA